MSITCNNIYIFQMIYGNQPYIEETIPLNITYIICIFNLYIIFYNTFYFHFDYIYFNLFNTIISLFEEFKVKLNLSKL